MTAAAEEAAPRWQDELYDLLRANGTAFVLMRVAPTPPPKFKRNLDPSACRDRFRAALPS